MTEAIAPAASSRNVYRYLRTPAYPGQLRLKTWAYVIPPRSASDPEWLTRAVDFWRLQAETFGLKFEPDVQVMVDFQHGCVTTAAHVAEVLPGRRTHDFATPRVAEKRLTDALRIANDEELLS